MSRAALTLAVTLWADELDAGRAYVSGFCPEDWTELVEFVLDDFYYDENQDPDCSEAHAEALVASLRASAQALL